MVTTPSSYRIRRPAVAGYYYPQQPDLLADAVDGWVNPHVSTPAVAVIVPHGSYRHSGAITGAVLSRVRVPRRCLIIGPSHIGRATPWSIMVTGAYRTPLGDVPIDQPLAEALQDRCPFLQSDEAAQRGEHAIEVQLPFLQRLAPADLTVVPIIMALGCEQESLQLAEAVAQVVRMVEEPTLLIASSDLSHYESQACGRIHDQAIIERICAMDSRGLVRYVREADVLMCGWGAVACVLDASQRLGVSVTDGVAYGSSDQAGGDPHSVIGYAGFVVR